MSKTKILYVEDEPFLAKIVKESLESRGYDVNLVADGLHAVPAFQQYAPNICVLDIMLPNKDGFEIGEEIRALSPPIPILYLTAKNQMEDLLKGFKAGGNDYIRKPFSIEELIVRIQNLLQLVSSNLPTGQAGHTFTKRSPDLIPLGRYQFHVKKYELQLEQHTQKLSHREAELLKLLTAQPNQTVERKYILKKLWGDDSFFNSRNLDVYITKLRGYLKADDDVQIITLKGVGYRLAT